MTRSILLKGAGLTKCFHGKAVVNDLSFEVREGEVVGLLGPNGAGKTTAFHMTIGLIKPDSGTIYFKNRDITDLPIHQRTRLGMGYLSQEPSIFRHLTVEENILCILEIQKMHPAVRQQRLQTLLCELNLQKLAKKRAITLSGGEQRRLEITRALATKPALLLLDEPFASIDPLAIGDVKKMIQLLKNRGISILITDHNAREIFSIADRSYLVQEGRALVSGSIDQLLENQEARSSYFGEDFRL